MSVCVSPCPATCLASLVGGVCVCMCVTLSGDLPCESCRRGVRVYVCVCVTLSGDLPCESCRRGVRVYVCHPVRRLALRVL